MNSNKKGGYDYKFKLGGNNMISVGVDVSKGKSAICIIKPYGEVLEKPYELEHTKIGLRKLADLIFKYDEEVRVVLEATGAYHLPVLNYLQRYGIFVSVINPLVMKKYSSISIRKGKTDKMDAIKIANYGIDNWTRLACYQASGETYEELNTLTRQYSQYVSMKIKSKITLVNLLDKTMPRITKLLKNAENTNKDKLNAFTKEFWHYDNITKSTEKQFIVRYLKWAKREGYHQNDAKAKAIYNLASQGIPTLSSNYHSTKMIVLEAVRVLREISKTLSIILTQMQSLSKGLKEYSIVREMGGVGEKLAPRIIGCIGDARRFHSAKALIAYAGIDAPPYQSGAFDGTKRHISKRGSAYLRKTGYEIMKSVKVVKPTDDAAVYQFILKKEAEGKPKKVAKIAGLNKFLRIYYARVNEVYNT